MQVCSRRFEKVPVAVAVPSPVINRLFLESCTFSNDLQVPEYKKLGELVQNDPKLKNRVVIAKVGIRRIS